MRKSALVLLTLLIITAAFAGCGSKGTIVSNESSVSEHEHSFKPSDCENPQTCDCGATQGQPVGHSWDKATCTLPKTCLACGITEGEALGHRFVEGVCSVCHEHDPETVVDSPNVWISSDGKYHIVPNCIPPGEESVRSTLAKARKDGHHACEKCYVTN